MRSPKFLVLLTAVALVAVLAVQVDAQQGGGRGGRGGFPGGGFGGPGGGGKLGLLRRDEVKKELELLDEQSADIEKLSESLRPQRGGDQNLSQEERRAAFEKVRAEFEALSDEEKAKRMEERRAEQVAQQKEADAKLAEILLPHQLDRLNQIELQQQGLRALTTDEVAKELGLSDAVKADIEAAQRASGEKMQALFQGGNRGGQGGDRDAARAKFEELRTATEAEILAKLTQSQRDKFAEMKGEPFDLPRFGFGGRGGNQGGQGGGRPQRPATE